MATDPRSVPTRLIATSGPVAVPTEYDVPGSQEIQLSSVTAQYNGAGAGGNFDPTLSLYSQEGKLLSRTKVGSTVTAGVDAICTWIPFLRQAAATSSGGASLATMFRVHPSGNQDCAPGATTTLLWDATDFNLGTAFTTVDHKTFTLALGVWWLWAECEFTWEVGGTTNGNTAILLKNNGALFYEHLLELGGLPFNETPVTYTIGYLFDGRAAALKLRYDLSSNEANILQFRPTADLSAMGGILMQTP